MPYNFVADSSYIKKLCSRLSSTEVHFLTKKGHFAFLSPLWSGGAYRQRTLFIVMPVVDFLLVTLNFFARCYG